MKQFTVFHIEGGLGKNVAATAVAKCIKNNYPNLKLIVVCSYPQIFLGLDFVDRVFAVGNTPYFYQDYIEGGKSLIFKHEPYFTSEHINGEMPLIENWCKLYGLTYSGELPELQFNLRQLQIGEKMWKREKPILVLQTNGGLLENGPLYSWARDLPQGITSQIIEIYKETHHIIQICKTEANAIPGVESIWQPLANLELFYLLGVADKRILIDSSLQHAAAALGLESTVLWIATSPKLFGYDIHKNIVAKLPGDNKLANSYLFDYSFTGEVMECPIRPGDILFDISDII